MCISNKNTSVNPKNKNVCESINFLSLFLFDGMYPKNTPVVTVIGYGVRYIIQHFLLKSNRILCSFVIGTRQKF